MTWTTEAPATTAVAPMAVEPTVEPATVPAAVSPVKKARKKRTRKEATGPRKPNKWVEHLKAWRAQHADMIKDQKLSVGDVSRLAKATYVKAQSS